jgi:hypothetical protein
VNGLRVELESKLVGKCGVFCNACRLYVLTECKGCSDLISKKETICPIYVCAENRGLNSCGRCPEFPCLEHYGSAQIYAKKKLLEWKKREIMGKTGRKAEM